MDTLDNLFFRWQNDQDFLSCVENWSTEPPKNSDEESLPENLHPSLRKTLESINISHLYRHQIDSFNSAASGHNIMVLTGTASGKSMCYNLPVIHRLLDNPKATALYIFPTKALSQDQLKSINYISQKLTEQGTSFPEALIYDGDTSAFRRSQIREKARLLITNPDMLHLGIMPHHTHWDLFFKNLNYIILDEAHIYRGVFGSHIGNVIRRLKRIAQFYGAFPKFIMTSATLSNAADFASKLIEEPVTIIANDGSPKGARHFILYNPPFIEPKLGIRRSIYAEAVSISRDLLANHLQSIVFTRSRRSVEKLLMDMRSNLAAGSDKIRGYRSGYLPHERREIENGLKSGDINLVVSTNALELGVDIGEMKVSLLVGYPGSIAALRQQSGRAGRKANGSLAIMIASPGAIDQYLTRHSEFLNRSPENALIDPDNLVILLQHLKCAAFELPFSDPPVFGQANPDLIHGLLDLLKDSGTLARGGAKYYWTSSQYPSNEIPLRSASPDRINLQCMQNGQLMTVGEIDPPSAYWMTHPQAIYLHDGTMYQVEELNLEKNTVLLEPVNVDYITEARAETKVEKLSCLETRDVSGAKIGFGDLLVTSQVVGYKRINLLTYENMGEFPLDLPPTQLRTTGYWLALNSMTVEALRLEGKWGSDPNNYGSDWGKTSTAIRKRDQFRCQICGVVEKEKAHHVHHKTPLRCFHNIDEANHPSNLITLCPACHRKAEGVVRIKSGLNGLKYAMQNLAPLFLMCDINDIGALAEPESPIGDGAPTVVIYDRIPGGIGLSRELFTIHTNMMKNLLEMVSDCECLDGCPACVGPGGEKGSGGKEETLSILNFLTA
jgi:DEAD/DEAH box helicase domain-containing protein